MSGELTGMALPSLPSVSPAFAEIEAAEPAAPVVAQPFAGPLGRIGIELRSAVRGTVDAAVDAEALAGGSPEPASTHGPDRIPDRHIAASTGSRFVRLSQCGGSNLPPASPYQPASKPTQSAQPNRCFFNDVPPSKKEMRRKN